MKVIPREEAIEEKSVALERVRNISDELQKAANVIKERSGKGSYWYNRVIETEDYQEYQKQCLNAVEWLGEVLYSLNPGDHPRVTSALKVSTRERNTLVFLLKRGCTLAEMKEAEATHLKAMKDVYYLFRDLADYAISSEGLLE